jgi:hypothetical protein
MLKAQRIALNKQSERSTVSNRPEDDPQKSGWDPSKRHIMDSSTRRPIVNPYAPRDLEPTEVDDSQMAPVPSGGGQPTMAHAPAKSDENATLFTEMSKVKDQFCPSCRAEVSEGHRYCWKCGHLLQKDMLEFCRSCKMILIPDAKYCHNCGVQVTPIPTLVIRSVGGDMEITLGGNQKEYQVGRTVPQQNHFVDIDLGPLGQRKVSRHHARFFLQDNQWYLEDLNSKAGTHVYDTRLQPNHPILVEDGMVIYFADVKFEAHLIY